MKTTNQLTKWEQMMVDYGFFHQDKFNILTHLIFVPVILASVLVPLTFLKFANLEVSGFLVPLNAGLLAVIALSIFYISLDKVLGWLSVPMLVLALLVATQTSTLGFQTAGVYALIGFFGGFGVQFIGHAVEGKKPALTAYNPIVAMISSPLFVVAEYAKPFGVHKDLWEKAHKEIQRMEQMQKTENVLA
ncbi:MAG: Mpo1-like protein [Chitinophagales bacterium]